MKVPFFELRRLYLEQKADIDLATQSVWDSGWYILGENLKSFEQQLKRDLVGEGQGFTVGCNSGTDAIVLSLLASGVGPGDEVIVPSHTAIPTITAVRTTGADPVFCDIDAQTWVLDIDAVICLLTARTKAVVAVHLYGNMVDVPRLREALVAKGRADVTIIEDVAQAQGAYLRGAQAGTLARFGAFSFYPSKNIGALGDGGAIFCASSEDAKSLHMLRNYGQADRYNAERPRGLNSRLDEIQAAVLSVRLPRLHAWNQQKAAMMDQYRKAFDRLPLQFQRPTSNCEPAWHLCVVALESAELRDALMAYLEKAGVQTLVHYPRPTHLQKAFEQWNRRALPVTESLAPRIVSLPMNAMLRPEEQQEVIRQVRGFFGEAR